MYCDPHCAIGNIDNFMGCAGWDKQSIASMKRLDFRIYHHGRFAF